MHTEDGKAKARSWWVFHRVCGKAGHVHVVRLSAVKQTEMGIGGRQQGESGDPFPRLPCLFYDKTSMKVPRS